VGGETSWVLPDVIDPGGLFAARHCGMFPDERTIRVGRPLRRFFESGLNRSNLFDSTIIFDGSLYQH
jgi:hypothetical protein